MTAAKIPFARTDENEFMLPKNEPIDLNKHCSKPIMNPFETATPKGYSYIDLERLEKDCILFEHLYWLWDEHYTSPDPLVKIKGLISQIIYHGSPMNYLIALDNHSRSAQQPIMMFSSGSGSHAQSASSSYSMGRDLGGGPTPGPRC